MAQKFVSASMLNYTIKEMVSRLATKVDKVEGKGLSTNDLTNELKSNYDAAFTHVSNKENPHNVTVEQIGALAASLKGAANGLAELDSNGKVPSAQLPSYVDDVVDAYLSDGKMFKEEAHTTEITGESDKIYIDLHTNKTYRWSGSAFVVISETLALGETSSTAYRGDRGKIAYEHSQAEHARVDATAVAASETNGNIKINGVETVVYTHPEGTNPHGTTKADVGLGNVPNVATNDQTPTYTEASTLAALVSGEKLSVAFGKIAKAITDEIAHIGNTSNPHNVTKAQVGLGNVDNTADADKRVAYSDETGKLATAVKINGVSFDGSADITLPSVEQATKDGNGQVIATTYIKGLSMEDNVITITKGDGATSTFTAYEHPTGEGYYHVPAGDATAKANAYILSITSDGQPKWIQNVKYITDGPEGSYTETNINGVVTKTFKVFGGATSSAAGTPGLVPAPTAGATSSYLKSDGTWEEFTSVTETEVDAMFAGTFA